MESKIKDILLNNNGISIINLEGAYLRKDEKGKLYYNTKEEIKFKNKEGKEIIVTPTYEKLYTAKMVLSLETYRAFNKQELKDEIILKDNNKPIDLSTFDEKGKELYSNLFVNLKFEKNAVRFNEGIKDITNKKDIRNSVYNENIKIDGIEYTFFKRGGSKARTAQVIFVKKKFKDLLLKPCFLGLEFKENNLYDMTSKEAYTSLIMSGIIDIIHIDRNSILIINDIDSEPFKAKQSLTVMKEDGTVCQEDGEYTVINCTTDGQGLMDESIYEENENLKTSTCALLRNDFLKCNALRTKLQKYYRENNITKVWDMYNGWVDANKIKLVITPNSCKYLKFADQFNSEKECYLDWVSKIPEDFGVVKTDHVGNYGYSNRLSYQMINSMNLTKDEVRELMQCELTYVNLLLNNSKYSKNDLKSMNNEEKKQIKDKANEMTYFLNSIVSSNPLSTSDMVSSLVNWNSEYRFTKDFKEFKKHNIQQYIKNLRTGAIRIKNSLYSIMISCPYEMLQATHVENNKVIKWIMDKNECYNSFFENGKDLISIRNPQINAGNIYWMKNTYRDEYKWFGYQEDKIHKHDFVVFVNTNKVDLMNRLQGADFDIDTTFLCDNDLLLKKAKENEKYYTPTNGIKGTKELRKFNNESLAELDNYLGKSTQYIGMIVNKSAIFNAYMYHGINTGKSDEYIQNCYNASSTLSSYSQIAIDMAKKSFTDNEGNLLNLITMMSELNYTIADGKQILEFVKEKDENDKEIKKMIAPMFFKYVAKDNSTRILRKMECGMDYLEEIIDEIDTKPIPTKNIKIQELLKTERMLNTNGKPNYSKIDSIRKIVNECNHQISKMFIGDNYNNSLSNYIKRKSLSKIKELNINITTLYTILIRSFSIDENYKGEELEIKIKNKLIKVNEFNKMKSMTLTLLYDLSKEKFISCFKENKLKENINNIIYW